MSIWVEFVKEYAKRNGIRYGCALGDPKVSREYRAMKERKGLKLTAKDRAELNKDKMMPTEPQFMNPKKSMKPMQIGTIGLRPTSDFKSDRLPEPIAEPVADVEDVFEEPKFYINPKDRKGRNHPWTKGYLMKK